MRTLWGLSLLISLLAAAEAGALPVLSEVVYDAVGSDNGFVFVEIHGEAGTSLDGLVVEGINGSGGGVTVSLALSGQIPADGLFVLADDAGGGVSSVVGADPLMNDFKAATGLGRGQSLPMWFDNTTASKSEVVKSLGESRDWTKHGIQVLSLYFLRGDNNTGNGQIYLKINDAKVLYQETANPLPGWGSGSWIPWVIDLSTVGADLLDEAFDWLAEQMKVSAEDRPGFERAFRAIAERVVELPLSVTAPFFGDVEQETKGSGELLMLALEPRSCSGCGVCASVCPDRALQMEKRNRAPED